MKNIKSEGLLSDYQKKSKSLAGWIFGGLSFIPGIGVIFGVVAIIIGAVKKVKGPIFLGVAGILFSIIMYSSLYYFGFVAKKGVFVDMKIELTSKMIDDTAGQIFIYKNKNGKLPATLSVLNDASNENSTTVFEFDPWMTDLSYIPINDKTFEIRSAGPDKIKNTQDDISKSF